MDFESDAKIERLTEALAAASEDIARVSALNDLAWHLRDADAARAVLLAEEAHQLAVENDLPQGVAWSLCILGWCGLAGPGNARSVPDLSSALEISRATGDRPLEADCLTGLGRACYFSSDSGEALEHFQQALTVAQEVGDPVRQGFILNGIGSVYYLLGAYESALTYYVPSLALREASGQERDVGDSLNNIGTIHRQLGGVGDVDQALEYYQRALEIARRTGYTRLEARCLSNMTGVYTARGLFDQADDLARAAHRCASQLGVATEHKCAALVNWADVYYERQQSAEALALYEEAFSIAQKIGDAFSECEIDVQISQVYLKQGELGRAREWLLRAVDLSTDNGFKHLTVVAFQKMADVCEAEGAPSEALAFHRKYHDLEREVFSEGADRRLKALSIQMQVEQARKDAELHRLKNVELAEANRALARAGEEKSFLLEQLQAQAEELRAQADELEQQATQDGLTGLHNRRYLEESLARHFALSQRSRMPLTVALIDVDHFKQVNDRFGHQTGDEVLRAVGHLLQSACRASDVAARYGGEEFLLTLLGAGVADAHTLCERLRRQVEVHPWGEIHAGLKVTVSIGISDEALRAGTPERLLELADRELYAAKHSGRNRVCGFPPGPSASRRPPRRLLTEEY